MVAFDGSATGHKTVQMPASSPLCEGLSIHIVMVGADSEENQNELEKARTTLASSGELVHAEIRPGEVKSVLQAYQAAHGIDLLVMGEWGALTHQTVSVRQHDHDDAANIQFTNIAAPLSQFHWLHCFQNCGMPCPPWTMTN